MSVNQIGLSRDEFYFFPILNNNVLMILYIFFLLAAILSSYFWWRTCYHIIAVISAESHKKLLKKKKGENNNKMTSFPSRLGMPNGIFFLFFLFVLSSLLSCWWALDSSYLAYRELKWQIRQHSDVSEFDAFNWKYAIDIRSF